MKNLTELKGNWNEKKGNLKKKLAILTGNDFLLIEGEKDVMLGKFQVDLGKRKEIHRLISELE